jgi:hypothetical protein
MSEDIKPYIGISYFSSANGGYYCTGFNQYEKLPSKPKERDALLKQFNSVRYAKHTRMGFECVKEVLGRPHGYRVQFNDQSEHYTLEMLTKDDKGHHLSERLMMTPDELSIFMRLIERVLKTPMP